MKSPADIIDAVAAAKGLCVPVQPWMSLSPAFVAACIEADRAELAEERKRKPEGAESK